MKKTEEDHALIRRYLLGDLSGKEQELFEESVITDPDYKEKVLMAEDELIEDYLEDDLLELDRQKFIRHFLSTPQQRQKLEMFQELKKYAGAAAVSTQLLDKPRPSTEEMPRIKRRSWWMQFLRIQRPVVVFSLAAAILLAFIAVWLVVNRDRSISLEQELARLNNQSAPESHLASKGSVLQVTLTPGQVRAGGNANKITIPAGTDVVQLQLALMPVEHQSYRAALRTLAGAEIFTLSGLKARDFEGVRQVTLNIPTRVLAKEDYLLTLSGLTTDGRFVEVAEYSFHVADG